jgi:carbamoyl-phosphate synthase large subunit
MGIDRTFGRAFVKSQTAAGTVLPESGTVFLSLNDADKPAGLVVAKRLRELGLGITATTGTADYLAKFGQPVDSVIGKVSEMRDGAVMENAVDLITKGAITFVVNTPHGRGSREDGEAIRKTANANRIPSVTTVEAALAAVNGLAEQRESETEVRSLQEYHGRA